MSSASLNLKVPEHLRQNAVTIGGIDTESGFPLSSYFQVRPHINFTSVIGKIEVMYGWSRVNVKVEPRSTLKFTSSLSYIASIMIFERVKFSCLRTRKLRDSGNFPYG